MQTQTTSVYVPVETPDNKIWAFLLALLVHIGILGFVIYTNHVQNLDGDAMETTVVTPDELAAMQGQIRANQLANANANTAATPTVNMSPEAVKLNAELAQKQAKWQQQQAIIAAQLDKQARQEQQAFANEIKQQQIETNQKLNEFKEAEITPDAPPETRDNAPKGTIKFTNSGGTNNPNDNRSHDLGKEGMSNSQGQQPNNNTGNNAQTRANYRKTVERIVQSNWTPPPSAPAGKKVSASFSISDSGQISKISVSSGDPALDETLKQALQASSLPPPPTDSGANYATNNMTFIVKPH